MSPTDAEQWETIALFNKCQAQNLRTKYDTLQASHDKLVEALELLNKMRVILENEYTNRVVKQALAEAEKL